MPSDTFRITRLGLIALLLQAGKGISGRKRIQKVMYLIDNLGWNSISDYKFHFYGTYSETLAQDVQDMVANGWIREAQHGDLYSYNIPYNRQNLANGFVARLRSRDGRRTDLTMAFAREVGQYSTEMLEVVSTLVYVKKARPNITNDELVRVSLSLKPQFEERQFRAGLKIFGLMAKYS